MTLLSGLSIVGIALLGYYAGLILAPRLLTIQSSLHAADILVVPGGDNTPRARLAAKLYAEKIAPLVLVTGYGDCRLIRDALVKAGVPSQAIETECESTTTWQNAALSAPLIRQAGVHSAVLVTSWFHSRRALGCFKALVPEVEWMSAPAATGGSPLRLAGTFGGTMVLAEYLKIGWYFVRYGLSPRETARGRSSATIRGP